MKTASDMNKEALQLLTKLAVEYNCLHPEAGFAMSPTCLRLENGEWVVREDRSSPCISCAARLFLYKVEKEPAPAIPVPLMKYAVGEAAAQIREGEGLGPLKGGSTERIRIELLLEENAVLLDRLKESRKESREANAVLQDRLEESREVNKKLHRRCQKAEGLASRSGTAVKKQARRHARRIIDDKRNERELTLDLKLARQLQDNLQEALAGLLDYTERNECVHEETERLGIIWTKCTVCGMHWADDQGGFQPYKEPEAIAQARAALRPWALNAKSTKVSTE